MTQRPLFLRLMRLVSVAALFSLTRQSHDGFRQLAIVHQRRKRGPAVGSIVAEGDDAGVLRLVCVDDRVEIVDSERTSEPIDVVVVTREEIPAA